MKTNPKFAISLQKRSFYWKWFKMNFRKKEIIELSLLMRNICQMSTGAFFLSTIWILSTKFLSLNIFLKKVRKEEEEPDFILKVMNWLTYLMIWLFLQPSTESNRLSMLRISSRSTKSLTINQIFKVLNQKTNMKNKKFVDRKWFPFERSLVIKRTNLNPWKIKLTLRKSDVFWNWCKMQ